MTRREFIALHAQQPAMPATMGSGINPRVSGDRRGDAVGFSLSTRRRCNGRRQAERAGVTPRIARANFGGIAAASSRAASSAARLPRSGRPFDNCRTGVPTLQRLQHQAGKIMRTGSLRWGNPLALRVPSTCAKELGASEGKRAEMTVEDGALVVKVAKPRKRRRYRLEDLIVGITKENYHRQLDWG